jgi:hypothetical protein
MPRKKAATFKCEKCGKKFGMAMHLGRHMTTIHGQAPVKSAKPAKAKRAVKIGARKGRPVGRPAGVVSRLGLRDMSLDQLVEVIAAAKAEAGVRITELMEAIK